MTISPADVREVPTALALLFGCEADASTATVAHAFQMLARGEWEPNDLIVAKSGDKIVGAIFAQLLPGAAAVIWPARTTDGNSATEDALTAQALAHLSAAKVVQTFLKPEEQQLSASLLRSGFRRVTQVLEMHRPARSAVRGVGTQHLKFVPYPEAEPAIFRDTLWKSHENSLDCPEMHGLRTPDELLDGYRDCARDLTRWWLAEYDGSPVGVLITNERELTFVGVVPEQRGKRFGRALVDAACKSSPELSLIVDARNAPAIQLYLSMGFVVSGAREVFVKFQID